MAAYKARLPRFVVVDNNTYNLLMCQERKLCSFRELDANEDYINVSYEEVEKVHLKVFNNSNLISNYYVANIGNYQYSLEFFVELNTYILTKKEATSYDYKKDSKIISNVKKDNRLIITEEFKLFLDKSGNPTNKGIIKYTFVKNSDGSYYLNNIERLNS